MEITKRQAQPSPTYDNIMLNTRASADANLNTSTKNGKLAKHDDGTIELLMDAYPKAGTWMHINMARPYGCTKSQIVGVFQFKGGVARFPIGFASFEAEHATLRFLGKPVRGSKVLIHEGLQCIDSRNQVQN